MKAAVIDEHGGLDAIRVRDIPEPKPRKGEILLGGNAEDFRRLLAAISANRLEPVIDSVHPLENVREVTARMEQGRQFSKIVLTMPA